MKRLLVLTSNPQDPNPLALKEAGIKLGIDSVVGTYTDVSIDLTTGGVNIFVEGRRLADFDGLILRGAGVGTEALWVQRKLIALTAIQLGIRVLNERYFQTFGGGADKLTQAYVLAINGIPMVDTYWNDVSCLPGDMVVKKLIGSHGESVEKINGLLNREPSWIRERICQPFVPGGVDYRILVIGDTMLGTMERRAQGDTFLTNVAQGGSTHEAVLDEKMIAVAQAAMKAFSLEYAGIDVIRNNGEVSVLEINAGAEFQGFGALYKIDVARKLLEYLMS